MRLTCILIFGFLTVTIGAQNLSDIPNQYLTDGVYSLIDLDDYVDYDGCYDLIVSPSTIVGGELMYPNLPDEEYEDFRENMTATIRIQYAGFEINSHPDDKVWVLDESDRLAEINTPYNDPFNLSQQLLFLNVKGNFEFYEAKMIYYSGDLGRSFTIENAFEYRSNKIIGSPLEPYVIDLAPLVIEINNDNEVIAQIVDPTYEGGICLEISLVSCESASLDLDIYCYEVGDNPCVSDLIINQSNFDGITNQVFKASKTISSSAQVSGGGNIGFSAKECISLEAGFILEVGTTFGINTIGCN